MNIYALGVFFILFFPFPTFRLITVRYTAPVENLFWKRGAMKPIGEKILKLIFDMNFDSHPLMFHVFSNGGAYLYQHIALAIKKSKRPVQVKDSHNLCVCVCVMPFMFLFRYRF